MLGWVSGESRGIHVSSNPVGESGVGGWVAGVLRCVCVCAGFTGHGKKKLLVNSFSRQRTRKSKRTLNVLRPSLLLEMRPGLQALIRQPSVYPLKFPTQLGLFRIQQVGRPRVAAVLAIKGGSSSPVPVRFRVWGLTSDTLTLNP